MLAYYTSLLYYTLIKNIYGPAPCFILALFSSYYMHDSEPSRYHAFSRKMLQSKPESHIENTFIRLCSFSICLLCACALDC